VDARQRLEQACADLAKQHPGVLTGVGLAFGGARTRCNSWSTMLSATSERRQSLDRRLGATTFARLGCG
jgi:hypothetical protein